MKAGPRSETSRTESQCRRSRATGGFSLIELIVVILVCGLLAGIAIPSLGALTTTRSAAAAQEVYRNVCQARQRAQATGLRSWVVFDVPPSSYSLLAERDGQPGRAYAAVLVDPATGQLHQHTSAPATEIASVDFASGGEIGFDWLGRPLVDDDTPLNTEGVIIFSSGQEIAVEPESGLVRLR